MEAGGYLYLLPCQPILDVTAPYMSRFQDCLACAVALGDQKHRHAQATAWVMAIPAGRRFRRQWSNSPDRVPYPY